MSLKIPVIAIILLFPIGCLWSCNSNQKKMEQGSFKFPDSLTDLNFFKGKLSDLSPGNEVIPYELSATLFTDYAEKQRLIKLPKGKKMLLKGDGLPDFPEGTLIAKTFFYQASSNEKHRQIIETRVLFLKNGGWFAGTYKWNKAQNQAYYTAQSSIVPVNITDTNGKLRAINYRIPSAEDCRSCHSSMDEVIPIGPKAMNLNRTVLIKNKAINQIELFKNLGFVNHDANFHKIAQLPGYEDRNIDLAHRAKAYLEINCAHCHNPNGVAYRQPVMFGYQIPLQESGIALMRDNIVDRMASMGAFHMPKLGTTVIDKEGVELVRKYIKSLPE